MQDHDTPEMRVECIHRALLLQGLAYCSGGLLISGNTDFDLHVGPISTYLAHLAGDLRAMRPATNDELAKAVTVAQTLLSLYPYQNRFMRVRKGIYAWYSGIKEPVPGYRLHLFVRAIEALTQAPRGQMGYSFRTRSQLFIGPGSRNEALLKQLYVMRSCIEHTKWWRSEINRVHGLSVAESLSYRALQAELIASAAYLRILESDELLRHFATDVTIRRFWGLASPDRERIWGEPLDISRASRQAFRD